MVGFFERSSNPSYLTGDYFVNASMVKNPKRIFGYAVNFLAEKFCVGWYTIFFSLKIFLVICVPLTWFLFLLHLMKQVSPYDKPIALRDVDLLIAFLFVLLVSIDSCLPRVVSLAKWFGAAWWFPYLDSVAPHTFSIIFGIWTIFLQKSKHFSKILSGICFSACVLLHPPIGLFSLLVLTLIEICLISELKKTISSTFHLWLIFLIFGAWISIYFGGRSGLPVDEIAYIYIYLAHASHYLPSDFGSLSGYSWVWSILIICILIIHSFPFNFFGDFKIRKWAIGCLLFIFSAVFLQMVAAYSGLSKTLVFLGPSRMLLYGYWLGVGSVGMSIRKFQFIPKSFFRRTSTIVIILTATMGISLILFTIKIDNPHERLKGSEGDFFDWISKNTSEHSVFLVPFGDLTQTMPFAGQRAIFAGEGFPFSEESFIEYKLRETFAFGSFEERTKLGGGWVGEKMSRAFRSRTPLEVVDMSKKFRIDYIVRENKFLGDFANFPPRFQNASLSVFKVTDVEGRLLRSRSH